ncbi:putative mucin/carbohydrate-binding domain-containing protein [Enterococcus faecalis]|jgi:hypothetical protein|uniref:putative mucin/carbohydrate-binding domain-containing protein n=1 Tax=Enterococcus faecalis TaxID=1351 RepID=UPI00032DF892|nr:putative mucin/carbohydrate-binding domain-containing protein [Enterococcus faecalis]EOE09874.1 hypothetical protein Q9Q_01042 [Enterococcus faecalis EnGen0078]EOK34586.1 hypothetical protein WU9_00443 [Enterococcus faecalis EnGen0334]MDN3136337.1 putative mucin/carbohydrate-binding domain-containing protein [Enterococcus faecalis]
MKKVCAILMISASVLGMVPSNVPIFTAEINYAHENELQMNPFVIAFIDKVKQNLVLDDNYHAVKLTEAATDEKIQKLYAEATALLVKQSSVLSSEEKQIIYQLVDNLLKAMRNELKKDQNQAYEEEKIKYYQQQFNELFNDSNNQMLKETITGSQLLTLFESFIEYKSERRNRDENIMNRISNLFEILNGAIVLWSNELEKKVDDLFSVSEEALKETVSQSDIEQLASDAEELDKLGVSYAYVEKITHKVKKAQQLFEQLEVMQGQGTEQIIKLGGQAVSGYSDHSHDSGFARITLKVKDHKLSLNKCSDYQFHWGGWKNSKYASIKVTDSNGTVLYDQSWKGNESVEGNGYQKFGTFAQYDLPEGSTVEVYHAEGPWHRLSTNDDDQLKKQLGQTGYTYLYKMQNNQLSLIAVQ